MNMPMNSQEKAWAVGQDAYQRRMRAALLDSSMWRAQVLCTLVGALQFACLVLAVSLGCAAFGINGRTGLLLAGVTVVPLTLLWPAAFRTMFRNLFREAADEAFTKALADLRDGKSQAARRECLDQGDKRNSCSEY